MADILTRASDLPRVPRRDPLDVPAEDLRQRIRLALSLLGHREIAGAADVRDVLTGALTLGGR